MYEDFDEHIEDISGAFEDWMEHKYRAGQKEHGGKLWQKTGLLDMAIDEAIDLFIYLYTLKKQLEADSGDESSDPRLSRPRP